MKLNDSQETQIVPVNFETFEQCKIMGRPILKGYLKGAFITKYFEYASEVVANKDLRRLSKVLREVKRVTRL